jgi:GntR family transcriptional regulator
MEISKKSFKPAYYQVAEAISSKIKNGELKPGSMIPSEAQLCAQYKVSKMTVRRGLSILIEAGYLQSSQGKGTFVSRPNLEEMVVNFSLAGKLTSKLLSVEVIPAPESIARKLGIDRGSKVIYTKRLLFYENEPIIYDQKYLPYVKGKPILEADIEYAELPEMVEKHIDILPIRSELVIKARALNKEEARVLEEEEGKAVLLLEQTVYSQNNKPVGCGQAICHSDRYTLKAVSHPF